MYRPGLRITIRKSTPKANDDVEIGSKRLHSMANCIVHKLKDFIDDEIEGTERKKVISFLRDSRTVSLS